MSASEYTRLASTLILALTQSEACQRESEVKDRVIDRLKRDNEKLKQQVRDLRQEISQQQTGQPSVAAQFNELFKKDVEKQAEIDSLRRQLARAKEANHKPQTPNSSSPSVPGEDQLSGTVPQRPQSKTSGSEPRRLLHEIASNGSPDGRSTKRLKTKRLSNTHGAENIQSVAEDGTDHHNCRAQDENEEPLQSNTSPNQRLHGLLSGSSAGTARRLGSSSTRRRPISDGTPRVEDTEPLRSRPLRRLNISDFKVNPDYAGGMDFVFQDVVRQKEARKCLPGCMKECCVASFKALAKTLPADSKTSEEDLLLEFLGPGSEDRIHALTPLARKNLVHEARAKRLADDYGRMHRANFEVASSPPDYWATEIPGTQAQQLSREEAKLRERKEVERRYQEAVNGGSWLFADE